MIDKDFCTETKVVGVTKNNADGTPIQSLLPHLKSGDRLILIRDYGNQYDENAIKVYASIDENPRHIGYISASLAKEISPFLDENPKYDIEGVIHCITGGEDGKSYGCNITIWIQDPDEPSYEELHAFARATCAESSHSTEAKRNNSGYQNQFFDDDVSFEPIEEQHSKPQIIIIIGLLVFALVVAGICFMLFSGDSSEKENNISQSSQQEEVDESLITLNEFNRLRAGMTWSEVYDIIGSHGTKVSETGSASDDYHIVSYSYEGYGEIGANAQLMFINGELDTMAQYGLESYYGKEYGGESSSDVSSDSMFSASENEVLVKVTDIELKTKILPPNSIGAIWMKATYTNNSKYTISSVSYKYLCKDTNETHYLSTYDTVLSGETSPVFDGFGPESGKESDIEFLTCKIVVLDENGEKVFINYDYKLGTYEMI